MTYSASIAVGRVRRRGYIYCAEKTPFDQHTHTQTPSPDPHYDRHVPGSLTAHSNRNRVWRFPQSARALSRRKTMSQARLMAHVTLHCLLLLLLLLWCVPCIPLRWHFMVVVMMMVHPSRTPEPSR